MAAETKQPEAQKKFIKYPLSEGGEFIEAHHIEAYCEKGGINPKRVVFLFPGNSHDHHKSQNNYHNQSLYITKSGGGLAAVAEAWGQRGYPSLSIPSKEMTAESAAASIEDLWRAVGAGFQLILPTKIFTFGDSAMAFDEPFSAKGDTPAWWGGIVPPPSASERFSKELTFPQYYQQELQRVEKFCNADPPEQVALFKALPANLKEAYQEGQQELAKKDTASPSHWYAPLTTIVTSEHKETKFIPPAKPIFTKFRLPDGATTATVKELERHCADLELNPAKTIFIFPGENIRHHFDPASAKAKRPTNMLPENSTYTISIDALSNSLEWPKVAPGRNHALYRPFIRSRREDLVKLADQWAREKRPCLSVAAIHTSEVLAQISIADIWRAVGAEFSFILPTQGENDNPIWWDETHVILQNDQQYGELKGLTIPQYYLSEFKRLVEFCNATCEKQQELLQTLPSDLQMAHAEGRKAGVSSNLRKWYIPILSTQRITPTPKATNASADPEELYDTSNANIANQAAPPPVPTNNYEQIDAADRLPSSSLGGRVDSNDPGHKPAIANHSTTTPAP